MPGHLQLRLAGKDAEGDEKLLDREHNYDDDVITQL